MMLRRTVLNGLPKPSYSASFRKYLLVFYRRQSSAAIHVQWKQVEQQVLLSSSVAEINVVLDNLRAEQVNDPAVFLGAGQAVCDRVVQLTSEVSTAAEFLNVAKIVPAGALDVLGNALTSKVKLTNREFVQFCSILTARCSKDFTYDFSCLQPYVDSIADDSSALSSLEYIQLLASTAELRAKFGQLNLSALAASRRECLDWSQCNVDGLLTLLQILKVSDCLREESDSFPELFDNVCAALCQSVWHLQPRDWCTILKCLDHPKLAAKHSPLVELCWSLLCERLSDLSVQQICSLGDFKHVPWSCFKDRLVKELLGRLAVADGAALVLIFQSLHKLDSLHTPTVAAISRQMENACVHAEDLIKLLNALVSFPTAKLQKSSMRKIVSFARDSLWQHNVGIASTLPRVQAIMEFGHKAEVALPSRLMSAAMEYLLEREIHVTLPHLLSGLLILQRSDGSSLVRYTSRLEALAQSTDLDVSFFSPAVLKHVVEAFTGLGHKLGRWLTNCAQYAATNLSTLLSSEEGCLVVQDLAVLLVEHNDRCVEFFWALANCLFRSSKQSQIHLIRPDRGEGVDLKVWNTSFSFLVTLTWACANAGILSQELLHMLGASATVAAVHQADFCTVRRLVESLLSDGVAFPLDARAEDACLECLELKWPKLNVRQWECLVSLQKAVAVWPYKVSLEVNTRYGLPVHAAIVPDSLSIEAFGGRHCLHPHPNIWLCSIVDDAHLPRNIESKAPTHHRALASAGYRVVHVSWRHWKWAPTEGFWKSVFSGARGL